MGRQEGGEYQGSGGGREGTMAPFCCPFREACRDQPWEQVLGCWGWSPDLTRMLPQVCLLKTRAQVTGKPWASKSYRESAGIRVQGGYGAGMGPVDREVGVLKCCG